MEEENIVSIWLGSASSDEAFQSSLQVDFSDDGDFEGSPLSRALGVSYYEDSTREAICLPSETKDLRTERLLQDASYSDVILKNLPNSVTLGPGETRAFLLYNYRHSSKIRHGAVDGVFMRFIAAVPYR